MALHKNGVKPIFQRHPQWRMKPIHSGLEHGNRGRPKDQRLDIDVSHDALKWPLM
jgi:hypothetical protein